MISTTDRIAQEVHYETESSGGITVLRLPARERLSVDNLDQIDRLWGFLENFPNTSSRVLVVHFPETLLSGGSCHKFWEHARQLEEQSESRYQSSRPNTVLIAREETAASRLIGYLRSMDALVIGVTSGTLDLSRVGLFLACDYRFITDDTIFENHLLDSETTPSCASLWFLSRLIGVGRLEGLLIGQKPVSATQAQQLGLAHGVVSAESIEESAMATAETFVDRAAGAVAIVKRSLRLTNLGFDDYVQQVGMGLNHNSLLRIRGVG